VGSIRNLLGSGESWNGIELDNPPHLTIANLRTMRGSGFLYNPLELLRTDFREGQRCLGDGEGGEDEVLELHEE
jgi:hypothetical protein